MNDARIPTTPHTTSNMPTPDVTKRAYSTGPQSARSHSANPQYAQTTPTGTARTETVTSGRDLRRLPTKLPVPDVRSAPPEPVSLFDERDPEPRVAPVSTRARALSRDHVARAGRQSRQGPW